MLTISASTHKPQQEGELKFKQNYNHSHFKWIGLITNLAAIKVIKTINNLLYVTVVFTCSLRHQGPNQGLAQRLNKALISKVKAKN